MLVYPIYLMLVYPIYLIGTTRMTQMPGFTPRNGSILLLDAKNLVHGTSTLNVHGGPIFYGSALFCREAALRGFEAYQEVAMSPYGHLQKYVDRGPTKSRHISQVQGAEEEGEALRP